jgi:general stress protein 26
MSDKDLENYDDVTMYGLTPKKMEALLLKQHELTFIWTNKAGHGMGVTMSYIWRNGRIWCTATEERARMKALARDPRCSVVISSMGTGTDLSCSITLKGSAILHQDQATKDWFYPDFARTANNPAPTPEAFEALLDTPARIIIEVVPEKSITFDGGAMQDRTSAAMS